MCVTIIHCHALVPEIHVRPEMLLVFHYADVHGFLGPEHLPAHLPEQLSKDRSYLVICCHETC